MAHIISFNNYSTTITGAINTTATAMTVAALPTTTRLPAVSSVGASTDVYFTLTDSLSAPSKTEIVRAYARSGFVYTISRGHCGTTAQDWPAGSFIESRAVAHALYESSLANAVHRHKTSNSGAAPTLELVYPLNYIDLNIQNTQAPGTFVTSVTLDVRWWSSVEAAKSGLGILDGGVGQEAPAIVQAVVFSSGATDIPVTVRICSATLGGSFVASSASPYLVWALAAPTALQWRTGLTLTLLKTGTSTIFDRNITTYRAFWRPLQG